MRNLTFEMFITVGKFYEAILWPIFNWYVNHAWLMDILEKNLAIRHVRVKRQRQHGKKYVERFFMWWNFSFC